MMKKLILLRHAKSDWDSPANRDFDRPLNDRGRHAAPLIGTYARDKGLIPDLILCSSAERTRQTCALFLEGAGETGKSIPIRYEDLIYGADIGDILSLIKKCASDHNTVMIIGHNPTMGALAYDFSPAHAREYGKFPTASFAAFEYQNKEWAEFSSGSCSFFDFVKPSDLT